MNNTVYEIIVIIVITALLIGAVAALWDFVKSLIDLGKWIITLIKRKKK